MANLDFFGDLNLASDLIPDKVIYRASPTYAVPLAPGITAYTEYSFPHNLPITPLLIGSYSDDNFATSYDFGVGPYEYLPTYTFFSYAMQAHVWADSTNVYIRVISHNTSRNITFHIVGLYPANVADADSIVIDVPPVQDEFLFTTDTNTLKHNSWFRLPLTTNGLGTYVSQTYSTAREAPLTMLCFLEEDGKVSYMNTMNTITTSGVTLATLSKANYLQISVADTIVKDVTVIVKAYLDA